MSLSNKFRRHSFSEGIQITPHSGLLRAARTQTANNMIRNYAKASYVRDTFRMINAHNLKLKREKPKKQVSWADKEIGTSRHVSLPRRYGQPVFWTPT